MDRLLIIAAVAGAWLAFAAARQAVRAVDALSVPERVIERIVEQPAPTWETTVAPPSAAFTPPLPHDIFEVLFRRTDEETGDVLTGEWEHCGWVREGTSAFHSIMQPPRCPQGKPLLARRRQTGTGIEEAE